MRHTIRTAALAALFALAAGCVPGTGPDAGAELDDATQPDASTAGARDAGEVWVSAHPFCLRIARLCSIECFRVECHRERATACIRAVEAAGSCDELEAEVCQNVCR